MKKAIIALLTCLFFAGCSLRKTLDYPELIHLDGETLYWDEIEHAEYYILSINDYLTMVETPTFCIIGLDDGIYYVKVKAEAEGYQSSLYSPVLMITRSNELPIPSNLNLNGQMLEWEYPLDLMNFTVHINNDVYDTTNLYYDLSSLASNSAYELYVVAWNQDQLSAPSELIDYYTYSEVYRQMRVTYDKSSTTPLVVDIEEGIELTDTANDAGPNLQQMLLCQGKLSIDKDFFKEKTYGNHVILINTSDGILVIKVKVKDTRAPEVDDGPNIKYQTGKDVVVSFKLYDKELVGVSGNGLTEDDYKLNHQRITIDYEFIQTKFDENPARQTIIITAHFSQDGVLTSVPFYINRR